MAAKANADADTAGASAGTQNSETVLSDKARQAHQDVGHESDQDINVDEALAARVLANTRAWDANVKRTYDRLEEELSAGVKAAQGHLERLHVIQEQTLTNMVQTCNSQHQARADHHNIFIDRVWNLDEQGNMAALVAEAMARLFQTGTEEK